VIRTGYPISTALFGEMANIDVPNVVSTRKVDPVGRVHVPRNVSVAVAPPSTLNTIGKLKLELLEAVDAVASIEIGTSTEVGTVETVNDAGPMVNISPLASVVELPGNEMIDANAGDRQRPSASANLMVRFI